MDRLDADVVIVGAGPAGIMCALGLVDSGFTGSILLLESGRSVERRICPVDRGRNCRGCAGQCHVVAGFGGAIQPGGGVKISKFPSGKRLPLLLGEQRAQRLSDTVLQQLLGQADVSFVHPDGEQVPFALKPYPVATLGEGHVDWMLQHLHSRVSKAKQIKLQCDVQVEAIHPERNNTETTHFGLSLYDRRSKQHRQLRARRVVVGVGRGGLLWWRQEIRRLGLRHRPPTSLVGLRFECPREYLQAASAIHPDFKVSTEVNGVGVKTFCLCAGSGGGRVKFVDYGDFVLLDGHVAVDNSQQTANIALIVKLRLPDGSPAPFEWIERNYIKPYQALCPDRPGHPVLQWYPDFAARRLTVLNKQQLLQKTGVPTSFEDCAFADLSTLFPDGMRRAMCQFFEQLLGWFVHPSDPPQSASSELMDRVHVVGLELEGLWDSLSVSDHFETSLPGLYVVGDSAGVAQGILQAGITGLAAAESGLGLK